ncbi:alpha-L-rhamnosidase [Tessaracoccus aquimaris]|uniref:alpha-L-rhamnosidase n=1 Tax=Tessaracoccus aquimaris TaxID=1332264 RepID=A0A1Q2CKC6_9ACTN|nr:alpha-L-rhamnosidase [Tessaracoccus aquimaris]AQP46554.1 alpha-L-rhamnosidase [Tessaracoccus aquimaris]
MSSVIVSAPRLEHGDSEAGNVAVAAPRVSWTSATEVPNWEQASAEISLTTHRGTTSATVAGDQSRFLPWPFADLTPRESGEVRVRVAGPDGWSAWSEPTSFFASFLAPGEWDADFIGLESPQQDAQPFLARREFDVRQGLTQATWYATAQGVYEASVNGTPVDDQILKPGWTPYHLRLIHETNDVTSLLKPGTNAVGLAVTGGWYTERFGFQNQAAIVYGEQPSVAGQLHLEYDDGTEEWVRTGPSWQVTDSGPWTASGIYRGEDFDARRIQPGWDKAGFQATGWAPATPQQAGLTPEARVSPEVRVVEQMPVKEVLGSGDGTYLLDFGQNLVGRLRITVQGEAGDTVTLRHAEVLDSGALGVRPLRAARATDTYTLAGGEPEEYAPTFTFHGFRYAEVSGWPGTFDPAAVTAEVIHSDMRRTGRFESSNELLNRLHENVVWGMRGNFLYLPTDCPQRDERLGWTGDIQIFGPSAAFLYDCDGFLDSWLRDVWLEQQEAGGGVAFVVPDVLRSGDVPTAAWGDVATVLPMVLFERFGDLEVVQRQYPSMKAWTDLLLKIAGDRHLWEGGFQFGDWVDPDSPPTDPARAKTDPDVVSGAFLYRSADLTARAADLLGFAEESAGYRAQAELVRQAWVNEYVSPAGRIVSDAQTAYALAIAFGIADEPLRAAFGSRLAELVRRDGYRISTGFVGTPLVNDALTTTGHDTEAARLLLQTDCPSWLYSVSMGATTIWERWDSLLPDGSINPGEMTSFNHYALGSVADWMHRVVAGLGADSPGYKTVRIAPRPLPGLDSASASYDGPYGPIKVSWIRDGGEIAVSAVVPPNSDAVVTLPGIDDFRAGSGEHEWRFASADQVPGEVRIGMDTPLVDIIDNEGAYLALRSAFERVDPALASDFNARTKWVPGQNLRAAFSIISPGVAPKVLEELEAFNKH